MGAAPEWSRWACERITACTSLGWMCSGNAGSRPICTPKSRRIPLSRDFTRNADRPTCLAAPRATISNVFDCFGPVQEIRIVYIRVKYFETSALTKLKPLFAPCSPCLFSSCWTAFLGSAPACFFRSPAFRAMPSQRNCSLTRLAQTSKASHTNRN